MGCSQVKRKKKELSKKPENGTLNVGDTNNEITQNNKRKNREENSLIKKKPEPITNGISV